MTKRQRLDREARRLWRQIVMQNFAGRCFVCGRPACDAHHLIRADAWIGRHEPRNGVALCRDCHNREHDTAESIMPLVKEKLPEHYEFYQKNKHTRCRLMRFEIRERIESLKKLLSGT